MLPFIRAQHPLLACARTVACYTAAVLNARSQRLLFINHALISPILTHPELDNFSLLVLLAYTAH